MDLLLCRLGWISFWITLTASVRILEIPPINCTQNGLKCTAVKSNCLHSSWLQFMDCTPTNPLWKSEPEVGIRMDENGDEVPVMVINWRAQIDGSIRCLNGTQVHVLKLSNNDHFCVQFLFQNELKNMLNPDGNAWSFSLDRIVAEPGHTYMISVSNLPKPNIGADYYHIAKNLSVPECSDHRIRRTKLCQQKGSLWESNINLVVSGEDATIHFNTGNYSEKYVVFFKCSENDKDHKSVMKENQTSRSVTFSLSKWSPTCCNFNVEVQPFFVGCENDCIRHRKSFSFCQVEHMATKGTDDPNVQPNKFPYWVIPALGGVLALVVACFFFLVCRKRRKELAKLATPSEGVEPLIHNVNLDAPSRPRKVLILYSLDHPLYKEIVLKLYAFLKAECGIEVILDLLDTTWLGVVGRMQWLDWQKQQIEKSSDKILILCSRGIRAKWEAMCGNGKVLLKEDVRSSMGDMLTPALSLIIPDFLGSASFGKYMVAYFEDVSSEQDIPGPFRITVKYKLMKHFEEIYFRIVDKEKHEPGRINRVEGISQDEYCKRPCGKALQDAIDAFQAYQVENPDWFEQECVDSEEEVAESYPVDTAANSVLCCVPQLKEGLPILINEVGILRDTEELYAVTPLVQDEGESLLSCVVLPGVHPDNYQVLTSQPVIQDTPGILRLEVNSSPLQRPEFLIAEPAVQDPLIPEMNYLQLKEEIAMQNDPLNSNEQSPLTPSHLSPEVLKSLHALQLSQGSFAEPPLSSLEDGYELEEQGNRELGLYHGKRPSSGSDQGYISRSSLTQDSSTGGDMCDPLIELRRLQEECFLNSLNT
ncbi:interleukin 17 receptor A1a [Lepisosteus oculatus]|uniref:interleukin 17 receptor A1a n=1 Tax=Lepisosteus oculatus TaxID=7918 RepID=UPI0037216D31